MTYAKPSDQTLRSRSDSRERRWRIRIFAITWVAYAAFYFTRQAFSVAKVGILDDPAVNTEFTKSVLGDLDAVYLAAYAAGQFVWGSVADRFGPRVVVLGGMAMSAVVACLMGLLPALVLFIPLMLVQGLSQSTGWASLCKNVSSFFPLTERGRVLGLWSTNYAVGGLVAPPFVGWMAYTLFGTWHAAFFAGAGVLVFVLLLFTVVQRNHPRQVGLPDPATTAGTETVEETGTTTERTPLRRTVAQVLRNRMVLTLGASYFLLKPARYALLLWGPVIVTERIPTASKLEAVVVPVAFGVAGVVAPMLIGWVSDTLFQARRMPPCVLSLAGLVVVLALFVPMTSSGSVVLMAVMLALIRLTIYGADSMISCVSAVDFGTSKHAATAVGFINGCGSVGAILGGLLPGYLSESTLFFGFAGAALVSCLLLTTNWNRMPSAS